jgi:hypothetical protein
MPCSFTKSAARCSVSCDRRVMPMAARARVAGAPMRGSSSGVVRVALAFVSLHREDSNLPPKSSPTARAADEPSRRERLALVLGCASFQSAVVSGGRRRRDAVAGVPNGARGGPSPLRVLLAKGLEPLDARRRAVQGGRSAWLRRTRPSLRLRPCAPSGSKVAPGSRLRLTPTNRPLGETAMEKPWKTAHSRADCRLLGWHHSSSRRKSREPPQPSQDFPLIRTNHHLQSTRPPAVTRMPAFGGAGELRSAVLAAN